MTADFFDRLEADLGSLTRQGAHVDRVPRRIRRRLATLIRRSAVIVVLAAAFLAASLAGGSPTSAGGHILAAQTPALRGR
jgi:hypothetical protein